MSGLRPGGKLTVEVLTEILQAVCEPHRLESLDVRGFDPHGIGFSDPQSALIHPGSQRSRACIDQSLALIVVELEEDVWLGLAGWDARDVVGAAVDARVAAFPVLGDDPCST